MLGKWDRDRSNSIYLKVRYDAKLELKGRTYYLEVERGNHDIYDDNQHPDYILRQEEIDKKEDFRVTRESWRKSLNQKLQNYIEYQQSSGEKFQVLITVEDCTRGVYDKQFTDKLLNKILLLLHRYQRGNMFLVCIHRDLVGDRDHTEDEIHNEVLGDPYGPIWFSPKMAESFTLDDV